MFALSFIWLAVAMLVICMGAFAPSVWARNHKTMRLVLGALVSPFLGLSAGGLVFVAVQIARFGWVDGPPHMIVVLVFGFALTIFPVAQIAFLALGLPFVLVARDLKFNLPWAYVPGGCIIGVLTVAIISGFSDFSLVESLLLPAVCGGTTMAVFWLIAEYRPPYYAELC